MGEVFDRSRGSQVRCSTGHTSHGSVVYQVTRVKINDQFPTPCAVHPGGPGADDIGKKKEDNFAKRN